MRKVSASSSVDLPITTTKRHRQTVQSTTGLGGDFEESSYAVVGATTIDSLTFEELVKTEGAELTRTVSAEVEVEEDEDEVEEEAWQAMDADSSDYGELLSIDVDLPQRALIRRGRPKTSYNLTIVACSKGFFKS